MKKQSRTVPRRRQSVSPTPRPLPLVDILIDTQAELQELVVASGLKVLEAMLEEDRAAVCGPRYAHQPARQAYRTGHTPSQVVLGGRKVAIRRPRGAALGGRRGARSGDGVPPGARMSRYARAGRCPPGTRRAVRTRGVVRDGCVVVNQAAAEFQQRTGHPLDEPLTAIRHYRIAGRPPKSMPDMLCCAARHCQVNSPPGTMPG